MFKVPGYQAAGSMALREEQSTSMDRKGLMFAKLSLIIPEYTNALYYFSTKHVKYCILRESELCSLLKYNVDGKIHSKRTER